MVWLLPVMFTTTLALLACSCASELVSVNPLVMLMLMLHCRTAEREDGCCGDWSRGLHFHLLILDFKKGLLVCKNRRQSAAAVYERI